MISELVSMRTDIEQLKSSLGRSLKVGPVEVVDAVKGFRIKLGEDSEGKPFLSPWYPHPESGGATKTWAPLSKGQIVGMLNPGGDPKQGILVRGGFGGENTAPSTSLDENLFEFGGVKIALSADGVVMISAPSKVIVNAPAIELGGEGGKQVARVGDLVEVGSGSSAGAWPIVSGSDVVRAL